MDHKIINYYYLYHITISSSLISCIILAMQCTPCTTKPREIELINILASMNLEHLGFDFFSTGETIKFI